MELENNTSDKIKEVQEYIDLNIKKWNDKIKPLYNRMKIKDFDELIELQAIILSYKHDVVEEIHKNLSNYANENKTYKRLKQKRLEYYIITSKVAVKSIEEKKVYIEADLSEVKYILELFENYINFLREMKDICESLKFSIKNNIEMIKLLE